MGQVLYQSFRLIFGTLYPAYRSFKAVKTKNVKEYVHLMTYWIVFAAFTISEEFSDLLLAFWFPLYYECKILVLVWLLSPTTRGSTLIYRQVIHPTLISREEHIDDLMKRWKEQSYHLGIKYTKVAAQKITKTVIETAIAGGGGLVETLRHSYSLNDLRQARSGDRQIYHDSMEDIPGERRLMPRSWHESQRYETMEDEDDVVQTRPVRGRRRPYTGSLLAITSDTETRESTNEVQPITRRRGGSVRLKTAEKMSPSSSLSRSGSLYATLPRKPRKPRSPLTDYKPPSRRSTLEKDKVPKEEMNTHGGGKTQRTMSVSPIKKRVRRPPPNTFDTKLESGLEKEKSVRTSKKIKRKEESTPEETLTISEVENMEDSFSMTYSEEEVKDTKKKCDIS